MEFFLKKIYYVTSTTQEISVACRKPVTTPTDQKNSRGKPHSALSSQSNSNSRYGRRYELVRRGGVVLLLVLLYCARFKLKLSRIILILPY